MAKFAINMNTLKQSKLPDIHFSIVIVDFAVLQI